MERANKIGIVILFGIAGIFLRTDGGTVITANLPANTAIINIDAVADGAASYNIDQSLWYQPFNMSGTLVEYTVQPGTYGFRVINPTDAAALFPSLTPAQANQIYTAWTFNAPWTSDYLVFDSSATTNGSIPQLFDGGYSNTNGGANNWTFYSNAADAYNAAISGNFYNLIRTAATGGRDSSNNLTAYTFTNAATLIFVVPDQGLFDNGGGVSVLIFPTNTTPALQINLSGGQAVLQWTTNATGFTLAQTTNLSGAIWNDVTQSPGIVNSNYSVTLPLESTSHFFRLHNP